MKRWLVRGLAGMAVGFVAVYGGDCAVFALRGAPMGQVTVSRMLAVPLKGNKQEIDDLGSAAAACSISLFPQNGADACWWLRRHTEQAEKL